MKNTFLGIASGYICSQVAIFFLSLVATMILRPSWPEEPPLLLYMLSLIFVLVSGFVGGWVGHLFDDDHGDAIMWGMIVIHIIVTAVFSFFAVAPTPFWYLAGYVVLYIAGAIFGRQFNKQVNLF